MQKQNILCRWIGDRALFEKKAILFFIFMLTIFAYSAVKELQLSIFTHLVDKKSIFDAKILALAVMFPGGWIFSILVDYLSQMAILKVYTGFYACLGLLFSYFFSICNFDGENGRSFAIIAWLFYCYVESFSAYVIASFWSLVNSVSTPKEAEQNYPFFVGGSKIGGMIATYLGYHIMAYLNMTNNFKISLVMYMHSFALILIPLLLHLLETRVKPQYLKSYSETVAKEKVKKTGVWSGIKLLVSEPYILGIFLTILFFELVNQVINFQRVVVAEHSANGDIAAMSASLYLNVFPTHLFGFFFAIVATSSLLRLLGLKRTLVLPPLIIGFLAIMFSIDNTSSFWLTWAYVGVHIINYTLSTPAREALFIVTVKDVRFKSKSWIDSFGSKFSKLCGQGINKIGYNLVKFGIIGESVFIGSTFLLIIVSWAIVAWLLGSKYQKLIDKGEIIGKET